MKVFATFLVAVGYTFLWCYQGHVFLPLFSCFHHCEMFSVIITMTFLDLVDPHALKISYHNILIRHLLTALG